MSIKSKMAVVIGTIVVLCLLGLSGKGSVPPDNDWEYKVVTTWDHSDLTPPNLEQLNDIGKEGWELVTVLTEEGVRGSLRQTKRTYYFKRPN